MTTIKLVKISKTKMHDHLYMTVGNDEIVGGGKIIIKNSCPLTAKDILIFKVVTEECE